MGCWNHTCAISNLHITAGQDVVVFLLLKNKNSGDGSFCYGNALYDVMPLPFYGKYDDYGGVEECHGFGLPVILEELKARLYKFGQGPNSCHDCEVTPEDLTVETMFKADHENRLGIQDHPSWNQDDYDKRELEKIREETGLSDSQQFELNRLSSKIKQEDTFRQVTHVVVHGDIFKSITEKWYIEDYVGDGKGTAGYNNNYNHIYFRDLIAYIPAFVEKMRDTKEEHEREIAELGPGAEARARALFRLLSKLGRDDWNSPNLAARWIGHFRDSSGGVWDFINVNERVNEYVEHGDWDGLSKFTHEVLTAAWINSFMSYTRKIWVKQAGQGSQNSEPLGYRVLAQAMLDILDAERAEQEEFDEDGEFSEEDNAEASEYFLPKGDPK